MEIYEAAEGKVPTRTSNDSSREAIAKEDEFGEMSDDSQTLGGGPLASRVLRRRTNGSRLGRLRSSKIIRGCDA